MLELRNRTIEKLNKEFNKVQEVYRTINITLKCDGTKMAIREIAIVSSITGKRVGNAGYVVKWNDNERELYDIKELATFLINYQKITEAFPEEECAVINGEKLHISEYAKRLRMGIPGYSESFYNEWVKDLR